MAAALLGMAILWQLRSQPSSSNLVPNASLTAAQPSLAPSESPWPSDTASPSPILATPSPVIATPSPVLATPSPLPLHAWHVPILMYHLIATRAEVGDADPTLVISPTLFAAQMDLLRRQGWHTITLTALAADLAAGQHPPSHTFVVTLDDGHVDGFREAFPILQANGFVATYFVPTGRIGGTSRLIKDDYLTSDELVTLATAGMEIADHTVHHVSLTSLSQTAAVSEIVGAADFIARLLGAPPITFAYPFGEWSQSVVADVRAAGFLMAVTTAEGCLETRAVRYVVPRVRVGPWTTAADLLQRVRSCDG